MTFTNLESKIQHFGGALQMLRSSSAPSYPFPIPSEQTNWRDEQRAWKEDGILYDITNFGTDVYFTGPDLKKLFTDVATNGFTTFGTNKARRLVAVNYDGYLIDDAILFGLDNEEYVSVGAPTAANWITYHAEVENYRVEIVRDEPIPVGSSLRKRYFRYLLQGPATLEALRKASDGTLPDIKFFTVGDLRVDGLPVRALNHTMSGVPGDEHTGFEVYGPVQYAERVKRAILDAGSELGMIEGGAISYPSSAVESGWLSPLPAIFSGSDMRPYRQWLGVDNLEVFSSVGGSFDSTCIQDYYVTPWELGYGKSVNLNHDFVGKEGLLKRRDDQSREKVWLQWNNDDVARTQYSSLYDAEPAKFIGAPMAVYSSYQYDTVTVDGKSVGWSGWAGYTANMRSYASLSVVDRAIAVDGKEVVLTWGEPAHRHRRANVEQHVQTEIRATIRTNSPV